MRLPPIASHTVSNGPLLRGIALGALLDGVPEAIIAVTMAVAAGAILAMLTDTMIPEAFETAHDFAGLITVAGFLAAFALSKLWP